MGRAVNAGLIGIGLFWLLLLFLVFGRDIGEYSKSEELITRAERFRQLQRLGAELAVEHYQLTRYLSGAPGVLPALNSQKQRVDAEFQQWRVSQLDGEQMSGLNELVLDLSRRRQEAVQKNSERGQLYEWRQYYLQLSSAIEAELRREYAVIRFSQESGARGLVNLGWQAWGIQQAGLWLANGIAQRFQGKIPLTLEEDALLQLKRRELPAMMDMLTNSVAAAADSQSMVSVRQANFYWQRMLDSSDAQLNLRVGSTFQLGESQYQQLGEAVINAARAQLLQLHEQERQSWHSWGGAAKPSGLDFAGIQSDFLAALWLVLLADPAKNPAATASHAHAAGFCC